MYNLGVKDCLLFHDVIHHNLDLKVPPIVKSMAVPKAVTSQ